MKTLFDLYIERWTEPSDINELLLVLVEFARDCSSIAEFGVRTGNSTIALLFGLSTRHGCDDGRILYSYDRKKPQAPKNLPVIAEAAGVNWQFTLANTAGVEIPLVDMLFVDTRHTYAQVKAEIRKENLDKVSRYIAFHDTVLYGNRDESGGGPGILPAISEALDANSEWKQVFSTIRNNGLMVYKRVE